MKKLTAWICLIAASLTALLFGGCGLLKSCFASSNVLEIFKEYYNVNTDLLENYEIVCNVSCKTFTGRASRYVVIVLEEEPTAFIQSFSDKDNNDGFSSEKNNEIKDTIDEHSDVVIQDGYYPDWNQQYIWSEIHSGVLSERLYTIYFPEEYKLIFFDTGH